MSSVSLAKHNLEDLLNQFHRGPAESWNARSERDFCRAASKSPPSWLHLSTTLLQLVARSCCSLGKFHRDLLEARNFPMAGTQRGLLPLPLPSLENFFYWTAAEETFIPSV